MVTRVVCVCKAAHPLSTLKERDAERSLMCFCLWVPFPVMGIFESP